MKRTVRLVQTNFHSNVQSLSALDRVERSQPSRICINAAFSPRLHARFGHLLTTTRDSPMVTSKHSRSADASWLAVADRDVDADVDLAAAAETGMPALSMQRQEAQNQSFLESNDTGLDESLTGLTGAGSAAAAGAVGAAVGVGLPSSSAAASGAALAAAGPADVVKKKSRPFRVPKSR